MRRKTRAELESELNELGAMREFLAIVNRLETLTSQLDVYREKVIGASFHVPAWRLTSGEGDRELSIDIVGIERGAGGVIFRVNGNPCTPIYLCEWCARIERNTGGLWLDAYARDLASQARKLQAKVIGEKSKVTQLTR